MPTVFRLRGHRFHFFANEGEPREPVQVETGEAVAKFWLEPDVRLATSRGYDRRTLRILEETIEERSEEIRRRWNEFFG